MILRINVGSPLVFSFNQCRITDCSAEFRAYINNLVCRLNNFFNVRYLSFAIIHLIFDPQSWKHCLALLHHLKANQVWPQYLVKLPELSYVPVSTSKSPTHPPEKRTTEIIACERATHVPATNTEECTSSKWAKWTVCRYHLTLHLNYIVFSMVVMTIFKMIVILEILLRLVLVLFGNNRSLRRP